MNSRQRITKTVMWLCVGISVATSVSAQAALIDRGGGLIYDDDLDITWLADANYARTSGYDADGRMTWGDAMTWAADMSYYDSVRNVTYSDWRLPSWENTCYGYYCLGREMSHLFYDELGGVMYSSILDSTDPDLALFANLQPDGYWSSAEYGSTGLNARGYLFGGFTGGGAEFATAKTNVKYAFAIRDGDVAAVSAVPLPAAIWMFCSGLLGLLGLLRRVR